MSNDKEPAAQLEPDAEISDLLRALRDYEQCDAIGVYCKVSRQAVDEAIELIERRARPVPRELNDELREFERLARSVIPFVDLVRTTKGRIPHEKLSAANWHELVSAYEACALIYLRRNDAATGGKNE